MLIVVDVESDGPVPGIYSMVSFAAVIVEPSLTHTFRAEMAPISEYHMPTALAVSGVTREQHEKFPFPGDAMRAFDKWLSDELAYFNGIATGGVRFQTGRFVMISDNPSYDHAWITWYGWRYCHKSLLGHSGRRLNDLFAGSQNNAAATQGWKKLRKTPHTHDPLDDAMGMAEALLAMKARGMKFPMIPDEEIL